MKHLFVLLTFLWIVVTKLYAQSSALTAGGNSTGSGGTASFSIGQIVYTSHTGTSGYVTEGLQQPYEISVVTSMSESDNMQMAIQVFPNPTVDAVTISLIELPSEDLNYQVFDMNGKLLMQADIKENKTSIQMTELEPSTYFLKLMADQTIIKIFKIVKH